MTDWDSAVIASGVTIDSYAELVDLNGRAVPVSVGDDMRDRLPLTGGQVVFSGSQPEQWSANLEFVDPWMVPKIHTHPLWGIAGLRLRVRWGVLWEGAWLWRTVCTLVPGNMEALTSRGIITGSLRCRDVLSLIRGAYGEPLSIAGLTIGEAILAIFGRCAPTIPLRVMPTDVVVPSGVTLSENDPLADALQLAAIGYVDGTVRTDSDGVAVVGARPEPTGPVLDWTSGQPWAASELKLGHGVEHMGNRITVVSTHADTPGLWVTVEDDDPSSPTYVGGPMGVRPLETIRTDKANTEAGLRSLGLMALGKGLRPTADLEGVLPQRPDLTYRHPALLDDPGLGVAGLYRVESFTLTLPVAGVDPVAMRVGMMGGYR